MDITPFLELKPAPRAIFDSLAERKTRARWMLPTPDGDWQAVTWAAYAKGIRQAALFLASAGLRSGDRAAIFAPNSVEWISAAMAIESVGGVMVPVYPANTAPQAAYVVNHSDTKVLFVDTAPLLQRVFEAWSEYSHVTHIVTLSAQPLEAGPIIEKMRSTGLAVPPVAEVERKLVALQKHESQVMRTRIEGMPICEIAQASAHFRGVQGRVRWAEGFAPLRLFINISEARVVLAPGARRRVRR